MSGPVLRVDRPRSEFHRWWMELTAPFHHLRRSERRLAAAILDLMAEQAGRRDPLSPSLRGRLLEMSGMTPSMLNTSLSRLRKAGFIKEGEVNPRLVPRPSGGGLDVTIRFTFNDEAGGHSEARG